MVQAHGGADLRADPQAEHQRLYLKLLGVDVYELAKADAEAEEKRTARPTRAPQGLRGRRMTQSAWRGEEGGGSRAEGGWVVGWREEGRRKSLKGAREQGCSERERRVQGGGRRERWVQGEQPPLPRT